MRKEAELSVSIEALTPEAAKDALPFNSRSAQHLFQHPVMLLDAATISRSREAPPVDVLVVEDEQTSRRVLGILLSSAGYRTASFRTAEEALSWIDEGCHPQFAVVDLDLPGINGLQFIDRLHMRSPETRAILVTATDEQSLARKTRGLQIPYLRKPLNFDRLLSTMQVVAEP